MPPRLHALPALLQEAREAKLESNQLRSQLAAAQMERAETLSMLTHARALNEALQTQVCGWVVGGGGGGGGRSLAFWAVRALNEALQTQVHQAPARRAGGGWAGGPAGGWWVSESSY